MIDRAFGLQILALLCLCASARDATASGPAGAIVAIEGDTITFSLSGMEGVSPGSVLRVFRRLPAARGSASYRDDPLWWEVGEVAVTQVGGDLGVGERVAGPKAPLPRGLDESGAPPESLWIGDRLRSTGALATRDVQVRVTWAREALFDVGDLDLPAAGRSALRRSLLRIASVEGPVSVELHLRLEELGSRGEDPEQRRSAARDAPFGPLAGQAVWPSADFPEQGTVAGTPPVLPEGRELVLYEGVEPGDPPWHYLDPITIAWRQAEQVAEIVTTQLGLDPGSVAVRVVPRPLRDGPILAGYEGTGDHVRLLARGIVLREPPPPSPSPKEQQAVEPPSESPPMDEPSPPRRRRLLEKVPRPVSLLVVPRSVALSSS